MAWQLKQYTALQTNYMTKSLALFEAIKESISYVFWIYKIYLYIITQHTKNHAMPEALERDL